MSHSLEEARMYAIKQQVTKEALTAFLLAIGEIEPNGVIDGNFIDAHETFPVPPTFATTFTYGMPGAESFSPDGLIHAEQSFTYHRPLRVGETYYCSQHLADTSTRVMRGSRMTFYIYEQYVDTAFERVISARMVVFRRTLLTQGEEVAL
ncbi:FAS1-like dehydratase domain-containing protein [Ferroacidibacillus organovorans]|uniref:FAS1-like dehydratase domain-containing protein n=1 Tax=Ferroacidibacillus organovorans TaxID=1765683 RepID=A0A162UN70_9BACL|nr:MaoC family dehydratase N-terminal domain-containing protein [Ferroacidibacillus organovorans]KYP81895.1 hypothetical protein AYJ22_15810 [Ferroacidibacillus organovorans]OPG15548.1 hypothetical protein B2M26_10750 [Ferroacidibacillus organovorans]